MNPLLTQFGATRSALRSDHLLQTPDTFVRTPLPQRIALLKSEYGHFLQDPTLLLERLRPLVPLHGKSAFARWETLAAGGNWDRVFLVSKD